MENVRHPLYRQVVLFMQYGSLVYFYHYSFEGAVMMDTTLAETCR